MACDSDRLTRDRRSGQSSYIWRLVALMMATARLACDVDMIEEMAGQQLPIVWVHVLLLPPCGVDL